MSLWKSKTRPKSVDQYRLTVCQTLIAQAATVYHPFLDPTVNHLRKIFTFSKDLTELRFCQRVSQKKDNWPQIPSTDLPAGAEGFSIPVHPHKGQTTLGVEVATEAVKDPVLEEALQPRVVLELDHHLQERIGRFR